MSTFFSAHYIVRATEAERRNDLLEAAQCYRSAVQNDPYSEAAWRGLAGILISPAERRYCLEKARAINWANEHIRHELAALSGVESSEPRILATPASFWTSEDKATIGRVSDVELAQGITRRNKRIVGGFAALFLAVFGWVFWANSPPVDFRATPLLPTRAAVVQVAQAVQPTATPRPTSTPAPTRTATPEPTPDPARVVLVRQALLYGQPVGAVLGSLCTTADMQALAKQQVGNTLWVQVRITNLHQCQFPGAVGTTGWIEADALDPRHQPPVAEVTAIPATPVPTIVPTPTIYEPAAQPSGGRTGAICRDGTRSTATGRGACSRHQGVAEWLYK